MSSKTTLDAKKQPDVPYPKKPLTGYFRFQAEARQTEKLTVQRVKEMWDALDQAKRSAYNQAYEDEMVDFRKQKEAWQEKYGKPERKRKSRKSKEISKTEKEKGASDRKSISKKKLEEKPKQNKLKNKSAEKIKDKSAEKPKGDKQKREKSKGRPKKE